MSVVTWIVILEDLFEEVDTVSGLILARLGRPVGVGDRIEHEGVVLEVSAVRGRGVQEARVVDRPDPVSGADRPEPS